MTAGDMNKVSSESELAKYGSTDQVYDAPDDMEKGCGACCAPEKRPAVAFAKILACILAGIVFGWAMEKSRGRHLTAHNRKYVTHALLAALGTYLLVL